MRVFIAFLALSVTSLFAQDQTKTDKTEAYMQAAAKTWGFSGTVLVSEKGEPFYANGFGKACYQLNVPNDSRNIFKIGEITQVFTSAAVMQQVQKGLIELGNPIGKYIADLPTEWSQKITIEHLLSHTAGLPEFIPSQGKKEITENDFLNFLHSASLKFDPGTSFRESNSNYLLLGFLLSEMTGIEYEGNVFQRFIEPLALKSTGVFKNDQIIPLMSYGYSLDSGYKLINAKCVPNTQLVSVDGMYSSLSDLFVFSQALISNKVIGPYTKKLTFAQGKNNYGFGWHVDDGKTKSNELIIKNYGKTHYWQEGEVDGYSALISIFPEDNVVVIILSNNDLNFHSARILYPMHDALSAIVFNQTYPPPVESVLTQPR